MSVRKRKRNEQWGPKVAWYLCSFPVNWFLTRAFIMFFYNKWNNLNFLKNEAAIISNKTSSLRLPLFPWKCNFILPLAHIHTRWKCQVQINAVKFKDIVSVLRQNHCMQMKNGHQLKMNKQTDYAIAMEKWRFKYHTCYWKTRTRPLTPSNS